MAIAQDRLKAYVELIQRLLSCPTGEEWILLRQNEHLVNAEFIQVMEQVAAQVTVEGHTQAGTFLHNLAAQLHHILIKELEPPAKKSEEDQIYRDLIQSLVDRPSKAADLLTDRSDLIGPELVHWLKLEATEKMQQGDQETAHFLKNLAEELNRVWLEAHAFQPPVNLNKKTHPPAKPEPQAMPLSAVTSKAVTPKTQQTGAKTTEGLGLEEVVSQLGAIATALTHLSASLRPQPPDPLWYMDALERAAASNWVLSTTEVEELIGVKPHCNAEGLYQRGQWVFNKAGKIGTQTAWQVSKTSISSPTTGAENR
ncbi:MAG: hypothetical protein WA902_05015 [Thermosynechococcaceae cyanobacterium]